MFEWTPPRAARLRSIVREAAGTQAEIADASGVPLATLQRILKGTSNPGEDRLQSILSVVGSELSAVLGAADAAMVEIPVHDIEVAAGTGRAVLEDDSRTGSWPFSTSWLATQLPGRRTLRIVRVSGDSMDPELRDGDALMIDLDDARLRDGMHVVRLDDLLLVKRVQVQGDTIRLISANQAYADITVPYPRSSDDNRLAIIGRAVWAGKLI